MWPPIDPINSASGQGIYTRYPDGAPVGDVVPFFDDGTYHLFVLTPPLGTLYFPERLHTSWRHLRSTDLAHWEQLPDALAPGSEDEPDRGGIWTGSVLRVGDVYNIFYTGHAVDGPVPQSVCRATSMDCVHWEKDPGNPVSVPDHDRFESKDWRDPFVFWNESEQLYWMLLTTRSLRHPAVSRGVVALQTSTDLATWSPAQELYETFLTHCPECPEIFRLGEKWVLGYSRFTDRRGTVYRVADGPRGPWHPLRTEGIDGMHWYAAKSLTDGGGRRLAFGWVPDRNPAPTATTGKWLWGGDLAVPRELVLTDAPSELGRGDNGLLRARPTEEVRSAAWGEATYETKFGSGRWSALPSSAGTSYQVQSVGQFGYSIVRPADVASQFVVSATVRDAGNVAIVGLVVQTSDRLDCGLAILCYPREHRVCAVDLTAVRSEIANEYELATTEYASVVEGSLTSAAYDALSLYIVVRNDIVEAFVAGMTCLTYRLASVQPGVIALLVQDGSASFEDLRVSQLSPVGTYGARDVE